MGSFRLLSSGHGPLKRTTSKQRDATRASIKKKPTSQLLKGAEAGGLTENCQI